MALVTKTAVEFVTAIEDGTIAEVQAALKKPGADRVVMVVRLKVGANNPTGLEVWDVG